MNPLLTRQLRKHLTTGLQPDAALAPLLEAISAAYDELEGDRKLFEHTLEVTSEELNTANERLRRESEKRIRELNRYYLQTLESQQGMILRVQKQPGGYVHTLCRGGLVGRLGWRAEQVEGCTAASFLTPQRASDLEAIYDRAWAGEEGSYEGTNPEGTLHFLARYQPMREAGRVVEIILSAVEITDLKKMQRELVLAKEKAESADKAKSEFLAVMSHEIRTPLNAVLGFNNLLQTSALTPDQRGWVDTVSQSGRALLTLLNDILDFSKIEAGQVGLKIQPTEVRMVLDSVVAMFRPRAAEKGIHLELVVEPGLPDVIITDPMRLRQILMNLTSNAVKFTSAGVVTLRAFGKAGSAGGLSEVSVSVKDTGCGVPAHLHERLFKPFSQADSSATRQYGGTGLGLAISQRLARHLGGDIHFESTEGVGSTFTLTLHVNVGASLCPVAVQPAENRSALMRRVLVAEDHPHNRELMVRILGSQGIQPDLVEDGESAIQAAVSKDYDLILMDVRMPGMDGMEATEEIRRQLQGRRQPRIVAVTANAFEEEQRQCIEAGMDAVLIKPFLIADLVAQLRQIPL